jgi:hypothetical protein
MRQSQRQLQSPIGHYDSRPADKYFATIGVIA